MNKWKVINKITGKEWEPRGDEKFVFMYNTGEFGVAGLDKYEGYWFEPLDMNVYEVVFIEE